jgi:hypothetical protein
LALSRLIAPLQYSIPIQSLGVQIDGKTHV